jgi:hypothetical protein
LVDTVWWDGAAGVHVGVDQRGQRPGGFEDRVEVEAQLGGDAVVGPESGGGHDPIHGDLPLGAGRVAADHRDALAVGDEAVGEPAG